MLENKLVDAQPSGFEHMAPGFKAEWEGADLKLKFLLLLAKHSTAMSYQAYITLADATDAWWTVKRGCLSKCGYWMQCYTHRLIKKVNSPLLTKGKLALHDESTKWNEQHLVLRAMYKEVRLLLTERSNWEQLDVTSTHNWNVIKAGMEKLELGYLVWKEFWRVNQSDKNYWKNYRNPDVLQRPTKFNLGAGVKGKKN